MATLGALVVEIGMGVAQLQRDVQSSQRELSKMKDSFQSLKDATDRAAAAQEGLFEGIKKVGGALAAYVSVQWLAGLVESSMQAAHELVTTAEKIGMTASELQVLQYSAKLSGTSMEGLTTGLGMLAKGMELGNSGSQLTGRALQTLGINARDSQGQLKPMGEVLGEIADRFQGMQDGTGKTAIAMALFGRSGKEMIPLLNEGSSGIAKMKTEMESLGFTMDNSKIEAVAHLNEQFDRMGMVAKNIVTQGLIQLAPTLESVSAAFIDAGKQTQGFSGIASAAGTVIKGLASAVLVVAGAVQYYFDVWKAAKPGQAIGTGPWDTFKKQLTDIQSMWSGVQSAQDSATSGAANAGKAPAPNLVNPAAENAIAAWGVKIQNLVDQLQAGIAGSTTLDSKLAEIGNKYRKLWEEAKASKTPVDTSQLGTMESWEKRQATYKQSIEDQSAWMDSQMKQWTDEEKGKKEYVALMDQLNQELLGDDGQFIATISDKYAKMYNGFSDLRDKDIIDYETYWGNIEKLNALVANSVDVQAAKVTAANASTAKESALGTIQTKVYAQGYTSTDDLKAEIAAIQQDIDKRRELASVLSTYHPEEAAKVELEVQKEINDQLRLQVDLTHQQGSAMDGIAAGFDRLKNSQSAYADGINMVQSISDSLNADLTAFFDSSSTGFMDFKNLAIKVLNDIANCMFQTFVIKPMTNGIMNFLGSIFGGGGSLFGGGSGGGGFGEDILSVFGSIGGDVLGSFASGSNYIPQTGVYQLHQGEAVIPADENAGSGQAVVNNHYYYINAIEPRTFTEYLKQNPAGVISVVDQNLRDGGGLRDRIRGTI